MGLNGLQLIQAPFQLLQGILSKLLVLVLCNTECIAQLEYLMDNNKFVIQCYVQKNTTDLQYKVFEPAPQV